MSSFLRYSKLLFRNADAASSILLVFIIELLGSGLCHSTFGPTTT
jgi:hypothetical protein